MLPALVAGFLLSGVAHAQPADNARPLCERNYTAAEYHKVVDRIFHQEQRIKPKQLYRLMAIKRCGVNYKHRKRMGRMYWRQHDARRARQARALRMCGTPVCNRRLGAHLAARRGWTGSQFRCLDELWGRRESGWNQYADNPTSDAYGIPQALPGSKMGPGWQHDPRVQIKWGLGYIAGRYGTPCGALGHSHSTGWY